MKKLGRVVFRAFIGPFLLNFVIWMIIIDMQQLWLYLDDLMGKGLEWYVILEFMFYLSANWVPFALPLSILLASIMTFGNLAESNELTAMKAAGMSIFKIMKPLTYFMILVAGFAFYFSNNLLPLANFKMRILISDIQHTKAAIMLEDNVFYEEIDNYSIRVNSKNEDGSLNDILIYDQSGVKQRHGNVTDPRDNKRIIRAKKGILMQSEDKSYVRLDLEHGYMVEEMKKEDKENAKFPFMRYYFDQATFRFESKGFNMERSEEDNYERDAFLLTIHQLGQVKDSTIREIKKRGESLSAYVNQTFLYLRDNRDSTLKDLDACTPSNDYFALLSPPDQKRNIKSALVRVKNGMDHLTRNKLIQEHTFKTLNTIAVETHRKFTLSYAVLMLFFLGAPLGAIVRKGGIGWPVLIAILLFLVYFMLTRGGYEMAQSEVMSPVLGSWLSAIVLTPTAVFIFIKSNNDSKLFDRDYYIKTIKKILSKKK